MLYRETGQFKSTYQRDMAIFPIRQDRWVLIAVVVFAVVGIPFIASQHVMAGLPDSISNLGYCSYWFEYFDGVYRSTFFRPWGIHGGWGVLCLQLCVPDS